MTATTPITTTLIAQITAAVHRVVARHRHGGPRANRSAGRFGQRDQAHPEIRRRSRHRRGVLAKTSPLPQSASGTTGLVAINALGRRGEYRTRNNGIITDTAGAAVAKCGKVSDCSLSDRYIDRNGPRVGQSIDRTYPQPATHWHFSPETGSPHWLRRATTFDFDRLTDVTTFEDMVVGKVAERPRLRGDQRLADQPLSALASGALTHLLVMSEQHRWYLPMPEPCLQRPERLGRLDGLPIPPAGLRAPMSTTYEGWVAAGKPCLRRGCGHRYGDHIPSEGMECDACDCPWFVGIHPDDAAVWSSAEGATHRQKHHNCSTTRTPHSYCSRCTTHPDAVGAGHL
jgi:hypothetical protein